VQRASWSDGAKAEWWCTCVWCERRRLTIEYVAKTGRSIIYSYVETSLGTKLTIVIASLESVIDCGYLVLGILRQPLREIDTRLAVRRRPLTARLVPSGLLAVVSSSCHGTQHEARVIYSFIYSTVGPINSRGTLPDPIMSVGNQTTLSQLAQSGSAIVSQSRARPAGAQRQPRARLARRPHK
jgi:hypothetical protein